MLSPQAYVDDAGSSGHDRDYSDRSFLGGR